MLAGLIVLTMDCEAFRRWGEGEDDLSVEDRRLLARHLVACERCRERVASWPDEAGTEAAKDAAERALDLLAGKSYAQMTLIAKNLPALHHPAAVEVILEAGYSRRFDDPSAALNLSATASELVEMMLPERGRVALAELAARCWSHMANADRILGKYTLAQDAFALAERWHQRGPCATRHIALHCMFRAQLAAELDRPHEACTLLRRAISLFHQAGEPVEAAKASVQLGQVLSCWMREHALAIALIERSLGVLSAEREQEWVIAAVHNLACAHEALGQVTRAEQVLEAYVHLWERVNDPLLWLRRTWLAARIQARRGNFDVAMAAFEEMRRDFHALFLTPEALDASLELALILLEQGNEERFAWLADELTAWLNTTFVDYFLKKEGQGILLALVEDLRRRKVTRARVDKLKQVLRRLQLRDRTGQAAAEPPP